MADERTAGSGPTRRGLLTAGLAAGAALGAGGWHSAGSAAGQRSARATQAARAALRKAGSGPTPAWPRAPT